MKSLNGRVRRLETTSVGQECETCGWDGDWSAVECELVWDDLDGSEGASEGSDEGGNKYCEECGHQWEYIITWDDLGDQS